MQKQSGVYYYFSTVGLTRRLSWNKKSNLDHLAAQKLGIEKWYACYKVRICKVDREYEFGM